MVFHSNSLITPNQTPTLSSVLELLHLVSKFLAWLDAQPEGVLVVVPLSQMLRSVRRLSLNILQPQQR